MSPSDAELLQQYVLQGSQSAFRQILERYTPLVYSICRRKLGDEHLAQDATQMVFTTFVSKAQNLEPGPLDGYLAKMALFIAKDIARSRRVRKAHEQRLQETFRVMHATHEPDERVTVMHQVLGQMREIYRDVVMLRYIEGLSVEAVGNALGLSTEAVKKRLVRALAHLRQRMEAQGFAMSLAFTAGLLRRFQYPPPAGLAASIAEAIHQGLGQSVPRLRLRRYLSLKMAGTLVSVVTLAGLMGSALMPRMKPAGPPVAPLPITLTSKPASLAAAVQTVSIEQRLRATLPHLVDEQADLRGTLLILSRWSDIRIDARWDELRGEGIRPETPVTGDFKDLTLSQALDGVLRSACPSGHLRYEIADGRILIRSTNPPTTRVGPIGEPVAPPSE